IAEMLALFESRFPDHVKLAYLPELSRVKLRLTAIGTAAGRGPLREEARRELVGQLEALGKELRGILGNVAYGEDDQSALAQVVGNRLRETGATVSTAESCTGGYIAHLITTIPGSSDYYMGSVVAYDNEVKQSELSVSAQTLADHGAVSEPVVGEMCAGVMNRLHTTYGISVSGIAGPDGATPGKPIGTVCIGAGGAGKIATRTCHFSGNRMQVIEQASVTALNMLRLEMV
ncbi:MAG TPA: nicotinamide-nucleotide amidohydrolase family protein, partial [Geopsychrobacteraceae bacterium]